MMRHISDRLDDVLWADVLPEHSFPGARPLLAHYTSLESAERIIESNELWFSNPLLMNDHEELLFGINAGFQRFKDSSKIINACESTEHYESLIQSLQEMYDDYQRNYVFDTYVLCFSEHKRDDFNGVLSMWRGYGAIGSGVAVVIDTAKIEPIHNSPMAIAKVGYASKEERFAWLEERIDSVARILAENPKSAENLYFVANRWFERIKSFALFSKHDGFAEEKEWRIVYFRERDEYQALNDMLGYHITAKAVEPKLKLKLKRIPGVTGEAFSLETITDRLILGPSLSTLLSALSFKRMLEVRGQTLLAGKIHASTIPFRK